ncbi:malectin domain-containing carbohydrate-binding protein [Pleomorphovibrio marinus]|uniref:malectin domain-containing carbohydrate-binding protein n=1 Tax=Pleomorphovibrio marinus TaxID=2164132 RepID=UPI0018E5627D|nr:malectin domain-containing carbohydrate-binding protein [Pleomorphovibrio marinus]
MKTTLTKLTSFLILFLLFAYAEAATYYFSSEIGDDSRSSGQAQNPSTPWRSIDKLNSIFSSLRPGDQVLFRRGDVFYGSININASGNSGNPIKIGAYGSGNMPIITSFVELRGWNSIGNGRFESSSQVNSNQVKVVLINGEPQELGRFPNSNASNGGYVRIDSHGGNSSVTGNSLGAPTNFSGGDVVIRKNDWITDIHRINSHSGNTLHYASASGGNTPPRRGYGFFIQNHLQTLDRFGEWYYNPSRRRMNVFFGSNNPQNYKVEVSTLDHLIRKDNGSSFVLIENLNLRGSNDDLVFLRSGRGVQIKSSKLEFSGNNGINSYNVEDLEINNSEVNYSYNNGISLRHGDGGNKIIGNKVHHTYYVPGRGKNGDLNGMGILAIGDGNLVENNEVLHTGFNGIYFGGNNTVVKNNYVQNFCFVKDDGGGIYAYVGNSNRNMTGRKVIDNIILDGIGAKDGAPPGPVNAKPKAEGVFLDDNTNGVEVIGNTIARTANSGVKMANNRNIVVRDNIIFGAGFQVLVDNNSRGADVRNLNVTNNTLISEFPDQNTYSITTLKNDISSMGNFDNNRISRPLGDGHSLFYRYVDGNGNTQSSHTDLNNWRSQFGKDRSSSFADFDIKGFEVRSIIERIFRNSTFDRNIDGINCSTCSWVSGVLSGGSLRVNSTNGNTMAISMGRISKEKNYLVKFKAKGSKSGSVQLYLRYSQSPWQTVSKRVTFNLSTSEEEYEAVFSPYADVDAANLMVDTEDNNFTYWVDDLEVAEADVQFTDPKEVFVFEYNRNGSKRSISLAGEFMDLSKRQVSGSVSLDPFKSIVLINKSGGNVEEQDPFSIKLITPSTTSNLEAGANLSLESEVSGNGVQKVAYYVGNELIGESQNSPYAVNWQDIPSGSHTISARLYSGGNMVKTSEPISLTVAAAPVDDSGSGSSSGGSGGADLPIFVNLGNESNQVAYQGNQFTPLGSSPLSTSGQSFSRNPQINGEPLFQTSMFGSNMNISVDVPNGEYLVRTYHIEDYFGASVPASNGQRVFNIAIQGTTVRSDFDIYRENQNNPIVLDFEKVRVTNGRLSIQLTASANNANISGIGIFKDEEDVPSNNTPPSGGTFRKHISVGGTDEVVFEGVKFDGEESGTRPRSQSTLARHEYASNEPIFQKERFGVRLTYSIDVPNGTYTVQTFHNEVFFGRSGPSAQPGRRVFDISLEGELVKPAFDIFVENQNRETVLTFEDIQVNDGKLDLDLRAIANNATISGISIVSDGSAIEKRGSSNFPGIFINAGSRNESSFGNELFESDFESNYFSSGSLPASNFVTGVHELFYTHRYARQMGYAIPVPNGKYTVITYHCESYFGVLIGDSGPGRRVFDIMIEGNKVVSNFDIYAKNQNKGVELRFENITVNDGTLNIDFSASANNALISGIAVLSEDSNNNAGSNLRVLGEELEVTTVNLDANSAKPKNEGVRFYPNPAKDQLFIETHRELPEMGVLVYTMSGQLVQNFNREDMIFEKGAYSLSLANLKSGVYLVRVISKDGVVEQKKVIVSQ